MNRIEKLAVRVLAIVDQGLSLGLGRPLPGQMCVQAAVNYAMNAGHHDTPQCVDAMLRNEGINVNDQHSWPSPQARAEGMRKFAIAQLGTRQVGANAERFNRAAFEQAMVKEARKYGRDISGMDGTLVVMLADAIANTMSLRGTPAERRHQGLRQACDFAAKVLADMGTEGSKYLCLTDLPKETIQDLYTAPEGHQPE